MESGMAEERTEQSHGRLEEAEPGHRRSRPWLGRKWSQATDGAVRGRGGNGARSFLLKLARDTIVSGKGPGKALELAMSLHVTAAIYCSLGRYEEVVPALEWVVAAVPKAGRGPEHALAAFFGYMQLGDTHSMLGRLDQSIECYTKGMEALGESDPRVAETCRTWPKPMFRQCNLTRRRSLAARPSTSTASIALLEGERMRPSDVCGRAGVPGQSWRMGRDVHGREGAEGRNVRG